MDSFKDLSEDNKVKILIAVGTGIAILAFFLLRYYFFAEPNIAGKTSNPNNTVCTTLKHRVSELEKKQSTLNLKITDFRNTNSDVPLELIADSSLTAARLLDTSKKLKETCID